jgi:hypothetical protein
MNMAGFTAEACLYEAVRHYQSTVPLVNIAGQKRVLPQLPRCGACTSLKWPNGTDTGACARACTDILGRSYTETCPCGGSFFGLASGAQIFQL